jgi:hypothetical protein
MKPLPQASLICVTKPLAKMTTLEISADVMELMAVLSRLAQEKRDKEAIKNLCFAATAVCKLLEHIEKRDPTLLDFLPELPGMPVYLSAKQQSVDRAVARLSRLRVGTRSAPPTWRGTQIEADNFFTETALEILRRLVAYRSYFRARRSRKTQRSRKKANRLPPAMARLNRQRFEEIWPPPPGFSRCWQLPELSKATEPQWWGYGKRILKDLWDRQPDLYERCLNLNSVAIEAVHPREAVRLNYAKKKIRQAFANIAKNIRRKD